jgi:class 3 adenylate cyclase
VVTSGRARSDVATVVGRSAARRIAEGWLSLAHEGEPRVGILRGEPGIGRSCLVRAITLQAEDHGFTVLRSTPPSPSGPPLLPMIAMLAPLLDQMRAGRRHDLSDDERDALGVLLHDNATGPGTHRHRRGSDDTQRFLAASRLLLGVARSRPVLLAVDDAQALDDASAELLAHLVASAAHAAEVVPVHLVTIAAVRSGDDVASETDRDRTGGRSGALRRIAAEEGAAVLEVDGLDELGLNELLALHGPAPPSRALLASILRRTGGNPSLALLVWRHVLEHEATTRSYGLVTTAPGVVERARLSLDDAIEHRVDELSGPCRSLLTLAAVIGHRGRVDALAAVAGTSVDDAEELLAEAEDAGAIRIDEVGYAFDDPLLPAALTRTVLPSRRRRLHGEIARALIDLGEPSALTIAAHLQVAGRPDPADCRHWGLAAASEAMTLGAWGDAAAGFVLALDRGRAGDDDPDLRLGLCVQVVSAAALDHDHVTCERYGREAIELARAAGDLETWCTALAELTHSRVRVAAGGSKLPTEDLTELLDAAGDDALHVRARILALLAEIHFIAFDYGPGQACADEACRLAEAAGDDDLIAFVRFAEGLQHQGRLDLDASDRSFARSIEHADRSAHSPVRAWARARLPSARWIRGDLDDAGRTAEEAEELAEDAQDWAELSLVSAWRANIAGACGRFAEAELLAERALVRHRRSDYAFTPIVAYPALAIARAMRGDVGGAHLGLAVWRAAGATGFADRLDILVDCLAGEPGTAPEVLRDHPWRPIHGGELDLRRAGALLAQIEVAAAAGDDELLAGSAAVFELHHRGVRFVPGSLSLVARLCAAAASVDDVDTGLDWIDTARRESGRAGAAAERARCDLDEALLRRRRDAPGDAERADQLLVHASVAFDRLGMLGHLRQAQHHLGARAPSASGARKVILFTDLVESTSLNATAGDVAYVELLRAHDRIVRDLLRRHAGVEFKHTGDGIAAWFASGAQAVECALAVHERLTGLLLADTGVAVQTRCGLAAGAPIAEGSDLFGLAVATAARICAAAPAGGVLASAEVADLARGPTVRFVPFGEVSLRGIPEPVSLLRAEPAYRDARQTAADPAESRVQGEPSSSL